MTTSLSIKFRAIFLTIIFLSNTVVGFACSIGMGLSATDKNKHHHHRTAGIDTHSHSKDPASGEESDEDNCCANEVAKFISLDKQAVKNDLAKIPDLPGTPVTSFVPRAAALYYVQLPYKGFFSRCHHPPIQDIRIAIQSFQI